MSSAPTSAGNSESAFVLNLLSARDLNTVSRLLTTQTAGLEHVSAAILYLVGEPGWSPKSVVGPVQVDKQVIPVEGSTLAEVLSDPTPQYFSGSDVTREHYAHLETRRTLQSLAYIPIAFQGQLGAVLEVISFDDPLSEEDVANLSALAEYATPALERALSAENERIENLKSIARLTQLYDLEKTFHSTLEMDDLLPLIATKFRDVLSAQAVHIWMVGGDDELVQSATDGYDPTVEIGATQKSGEGIAAEVGDSGDPLLIDDPADPRLASRNGEVTEGALFTAIVTPLMVKDEEIGVVEAVNRSDGTPFTEEDLFLLTLLCDTAAGAVHNASLVQAERKVEVLEALVRVSQEITSTLDIDRVLQSVVNTPGTVIPYERAAVALEERGRIRVKAISGITTSPDAPEFEPLREMAEWASSINQETYLRQHEEEVESDREDTRLRMKSYFETTGKRGFYILPLADDQGRLGTFICESSDPDFLTDAHEEMLRLVGSQATVALRNASLYQEVPFIGVIEPILRQKQRFRGMERTRRTLLVGTIAAAAIGLVLVPIPLRVQGNATVNAVVDSQVQARVEGVVRRVFVQEGQRVNAGDPIAELESWNYRAALSAAEAKYQEAVSARNRALASNDSTNAGIEQVQADYWRSEVERARERLDQTTIRAVRAGVVATPHVEEAVGRHLDSGQKLADITSMESASVDVTIDESDMRLLRTGERASIKLDAFPMQTFRGSVAVVSPIGYPGAEDQIYYARLNVPNPQALLRPGMQGQAKILSGWRPAGYVIFRGPAMWLYRKLWSWVGW